MSQFRIDRYGEIIDKKLSVADCFNYYFSSIGQSLANGIRRNNVHLKSFLAKSMSKCMFMIFPNNQPEMSLIISKLKRLRRRDGRYFALAPINIILTLANIGNISVSSGDVPSRMKVSRITSISKLVTLLCFQTTYQSLFSLQTQKFVKNSCKISHPLVKTCSTYMTAAEIVQYIARVLYSNDIITGGFFLDLS